MVNYLYRNGYISYRRYFNSMNNYSNNYKYEKWFSLKQIAKNGKKSQ